MLALLTYYISVVKQTAQELRKISSVIICRSFVACPAISKETYNTQRKVDKSFSYLFISFFPQVKCD